MNRIEALTREIPGTSVDWSGLSYQERRIYHWHEELDRRIGAERVPPALRVQPMLERWVDSD